MKGKLKTLVIWLAGLAVVAVIVLVGMKNSIVRPFNERRAEEMKTDPVNVEEYYQEKAEIVASYDVKTSENIQTEEQATADMENRGFGEYPVTYSYSIDGEYIEEQEAVNGGEQHPIYQTYYISSAGEIWTVIVINGSIIANPVSYNMQSGQETQLIISETEVITGYDSEYNVFYETLPNESELTVVVVDKIDAAVLDSLTSEVISGL